MEIDRARFLFFTSAIFAACGNREPGPSAPGAITIPAQPPATATTPPLAKTASAPPVDAGDGDGVAVSEEEDDEVDYPSWPGTASPPLARTVHADDCDAAENAKGKTVACALVPGPGPSCESFGATRSDCAKLSRWLFPRVAAKARACLTAKSGKRDICLFNVGPACVIEAFSSVCLDPSPKIEADCQQVMAQCRSVDRRYRHMTLDACRAASSAIVPTRRSKFITCAAESCDLVPCVYAAQP